VSEPERIEQSGSFVQAGTGYRFRLTSAPEAGRASRGTVVFVHGFAEELNKSRRMVGRMARMLAADGWCVVQRDLEGCGDSSGDFGQTSWSAWIHDVAQELAQAPATSPLWLWCMRAGALLAAAVIAERPDVNVLLWQPVLSGAQHLQQFLRLQAGARIAGIDATTVGASPLETLRSGGTVWAGGYALNAALASGLESARFGVPEGHRGRIAWFEVSQDEAPTISPAGKRVIDGLRGRGLTVDARAIAGLPFWQTQEVEDCDPLLEATRAELSDACGAHRLNVESDQGCCATNAGGIGRSTTGDEEEVVAFRGSQGRLWGVLSRPPKGLASSMAVLVVVGGPQYRVGSHRQFASLARCLARAGFSTLRFDYAGMGDSEGEKPDFRACGPDLRTALDVLARACPGATKFAVWGLCDAASAALMFATADARVVAIVAANPWARSASSLAAARVKHYYLGRIVEREFWAKLVGGRLDWRASIVSLVDNVRGFRSHRHGAAASRDDDSYQLRMARGLAKFSGRVLLILSGRDLTAREFIDHVEATRAWSGLLVAPRVLRVDLPEADHTFSRPAWQQTVEEHTIAWLRWLEGGPPAGHVLATAAAPVP
jgi:exosortase A-associated hydrolase 1/exosortase A-associated hydrolase 2